MTSFTALDLESALPRLWPLAVEWAESQSASIRATGIALDASGVCLAHSVGVQHPERIRLKIVTAISLPENDELRQAAIQAGLLGTGTIGLTLGYGIYLLEGRISQPLIRHECRHVHQYEEAGSLPAFLARYIREVLQFGYFDASLEKDAREHEEE